MAHTNEQIKTSFEKANAAKDGKLDAAGVKAALDELKLKLSDAALNGYLSQANPAHKGSIDLSSFTVLVRFLESPAASVEPLLGALASITYGVKSISQNGNLFYAPDSEANIKLSDVQAGLTDFASNLSIHSGFWQSDENIRKGFGNKEVDTPFAFIFNVHCKNGPQIVGEINEKLQEFKAILSEFSNEAKVVLEQIEISVVGFDHGVQIVLDISKIPFFQAWLASIQKEIAELAKQPTQLSIHLRTTGDIGDLKKNFFELTKDSHEFDLQVKNLTLKRIFNIPEFKANFKKQTEIPELVALQVMALSLKKFNFEFEIDHKVKCDFFDLLGATPKSANFDGMIKGAEKLMDDNGAGDFLEMFDSGREVLRILQKNEASSTGVYVKLFDNYTGLHLKVSAWPILSRLLKL